MLFLFITVVAKLLLADAVAVFLFITAAVLLVVKDVMLADVEEENVFWLIKKVQLSLEGCCSITELCCTQTKQPYDSVLFVR